MLFLLPAGSFAQGDTKKNTTEKESIFSFKGFSISTDLFGYAYSMIEDYISGEVAIEANFGNKFYPVFEAGYGSSDVTDDIFGIHYKSSAPYYRVGVNYNFTNKTGESPRPNYIFGAARFGWTRAKYDVSAPPITDPVWGGSVSLDLIDVENYYSWMELGAGVKVKIWKNLNMGWCIRYKVRLNQTSGNNSRIWYVPGFGNSRHTTWGGTYSIIYDIPL